MDKSWINLPRLHDKYLQGVVDFVEFARKNIPKGATEIVCPCNGCRNVKLVNIDVVKEHLVVTGFNRSYTEWIFHGEKMQSSECVAENSPQDNSVSRDEMQDIIRDAFGIHPRFSTHNMGPDMDMGVDMGHDNLPGGGVQGPDEETVNFYKLLKEAERQLYPGCQNYSLLSFVVRLMHIKCLSGWSNKSFTLLLKLLKDVFPEGEILPDSFAASKKLVAGLGLDYYKVHACPRDCMLYWGENAERNDCKVCHKPRYKQFEQQENGPKKVTGKIPHKVVSYLYEKVKKDKLEERFLYLNPCTLLVQCKEGSNSKTRLLMVRLNAATVGQLVFVPCNLGYHWILLVIDPWKFTVYILDSLGLTDIDPCLKKEVETALKSIEALRKNSKSQAITWKVVKSPRQSSKVECGLYVLRYMRELIEDPSIFKNQKFNWKNTYTHAELDEVRVEWIKFVYDKVNGNNTCEKA